LQQESNATQAAAKLTRLINIQLFKFSLLDIHK